MTEGCDGASGMRKDRKLLRRVLCKETVRRLWSLALPGIYLIGCSPPCEDYRELGCHFGVGVQSASAATPKLVPDPLEVGSGPAKPVGGAPCLGLGHFYANKASPQPSFLPDVTQGFPYTSLKYTKALRVLLTPLLLLNSLYLLCYAVIFWTSVAGQLQLHC